MSKKIGLGIIAIAVIALAIVMTGLLTIVNSNLNYAGFTFADNEKFSPCQSGGHSTSAAKEGDFLVLQSQSDGQSASRFVTTDVTGIDELLVIYEGAASAYCNVGSSNAGSGIAASIKGTQGGSVSSALSIGTSRCPNNGDAASATFSANIWKFKNNFDGTWSSMKSIGVGDIFVVESTQTILGNPVLNIEAYSGGECGSSKGGKAYLKIYNIVRKENAFAVCKADEFVQDVNGDGKIALDGSECFDLTTIVLNSEEAIKESYDEKFARIQEELQAKNDYLLQQVTLLQQQLATQPAYDASALTAQISSLQSQISVLQGQAANQDAAMQLQSLQSQLAALEAYYPAAKLIILENELRETKERLDAVLAKDVTVINVIEKEEQFIQPSFIERIFNSIISFFKNLFA